VRDDLDSNPPVYNEDEVLLEELQRLTYDLRRAAENPEYKHFRSERFRKKIECVVREEYKLIKCDLEVLETDKKKGNSTIIRFYDNFTKK
jgi:hypothetical protein